MATIWIDSAATGAADGTSYTDAFTTFAAAGAVDVSGDIIYVVSTHSENASSISFTDATVYTVNSSGAYTEPTANNVTSTGGDVTLTGTIAILGLWIQAADDVTMDGSITYDDGKITVDDSLTGELVLPGAQTSRYFICRNTEFVLNGGRIVTVDVYGIAHFIGCSFSSSNTEILRINSTLRHSRFTFEECDFSGCSSATSLISGSVSRVVLKFNRCLIPSGVSIVSGSITIASTEVQCYSCSQGDLLQSLYLHDWLGVAVDELSIYRTDGATYDGTNSLSNELTSSSTADYPNPKTYDLANFYVNTDDYTTDITFKVHFAVDGSATALNDDEFWMEVAYTDGDTNVLGVLADTKAVPLATGIAPTTETGLWTGLGGTNKQMSISKTITIGATAGTIATGVVVVRVFLAKASQVVFICPKVELS